MCDKGSVILLYLFRPAYIYAGLLYAEKAFLAVKGMLFLFFLKFAGMYGSALHLCKLERTFKPLRVFSGIVLNDRSLSPIARPFISLASGYPLSLRHCIKYTDNTEREAL